MTGTTFGDRLRANQPTYMLGIRMARTTDVIRMAKSTGHHAVMVDLEHSAMAVHTAVELCAAAGDLGLASFVRPPERDYGSIGRLLDGGATGVVAPRIETAEGAREVARACRFPPRGQRSQISALPQAGLRPMPATELNPGIDAATFVQVILETPLGVDNAEAIARVDGIDMLVFGANDFTAEVGVPGDYTHPDVREAVAAVARACASHDKLFMLAGIAAPDLLHDLSNPGACPLYLTGMDSDVLFRALEARVDALALTAQPGEQGNPR